MVLVCKHTKTNTNTLKKLKTSRDQNVIREVLKKWPFFMTFAIKQIRSVFWLFHIGSQEERRPLDYTTRLVHLMRVQLLFILLFTIDQIFIYGHGLHDKIVPPHDDLHALTYYGLYLHIYINGHLITPQGSSNLPPKSMILSWIRIP